MIRIAAAAFILLGLAGCQLSPAERLRQRDVCRADRARFAIGQLPSEVLLEQARRRARALVARTLPPDVIVTLEYRFGRLNLNIGPDGRVASVNCG